MTSLIGYKASRLTVVDLLVVTGADVSLVEEVPEPVSGRCSSLDDVGLANSEEMRSEACGEQFRAVSNPSSLSSVVLIPRTQG
jgi:hypothetical protein